MVKKERETIDLEERQAQTENAELRAQINKMTQDLERVTRTVQDLERSAPVPAPDSDGEDDPVIGDLQVYNDPFDVQNPHVYLKEPPGFKFGWINPVYRDKHRTWRGWQPVQYDDPIGMNLSEYLLDPPARMAHAVDNLVRRGDVVLCILPLEYWLARRQKSWTRRHQFLQENKDNIRAEHPVDGRFQDPQRESTGKHIGGRTMPVS